MFRSETVAALAQALAKAQAQVENAAKSSENPHFRNRYADLAEVLNSVRPVFAAHGLSVVQLPSYAAGVVSVETVLFHASGEWVAGVLSAPVSKNDAQGVGAAVTYCRRYALAAIAGIAQEDDDGNTASGLGNAHALPRPAAKAAPKAKPEPVAPVSITAAQIAAHVLSIEQAADSETLRTVYANAYAQTAGNDVARQKVVAAYNVKKEGFAREH